MNSAAAHLPAIEPPEASAEAHVNNAPEKPQPAEPWTHQGGIYWMDCGPVTVRETARAMKAVGARFVTITAYQLPGTEGFRLEYHWDLDGRLLGFRFPLTGSSTESIYDMCEAADWIEREVHEGFGIEFTGREYEPLLLREGDKPGVNLREEAAR
jgi:NADH:ubiquinone oxidoreductase subunit C